MIGIIPVLSEDDLIDIIAESLACRRTTSDWRPAPSDKPSVHRAGKWGFHVQKAFNPPWTSLPMKRPFVSEYMVKQMVRAGAKQVRLPAKAILSPLAEEWLWLNGIAVVRES